MNEVDPDLEQVLEWKRVVSAEINRVPPEERVEYINRRAEVTLREAGLLHRLVRWYQPYTPEEVNT
jgi:hypothetical protein